MRAFGHYWSTALVGLASLTQASGCLIYLSVVDTPTKKATSSNTAFCSSLVSGWDGDHISGLTAQDLVTGASANDGTLDPSVTLPAGKVSNAFGMDGVAGMVSIPDASSLDFSTSFTFSTWIKPDLAWPSSNRTQTLISKWAYTSASMASAGNWSGVNITGASAMANADYAGFRGAVFDGRYIYFVPNWLLAPGAHGKLARFDTQGAINSSSSWSGVDIAGPLALNDARFVGFGGAVFDGRYVYFVPYDSDGDWQADSSAVARYDTQGALDSPSSWTGVEFSSGSILNDATFNGYSAGVFDGRYVYFVPDTKAGVAHGNVARYDTQGSFTSSASWAGVDVSSAGILNSANYREFSGGAFDGRYVYLLPGVSDGYMARYDTQASFTSGASWTGVNVSGAAILNSANYSGYSGGIFDGRYLYLSPNDSNGTSSVARFDTQGTFTSAASWSGVSIQSASALNSANYGGYQGGTFDGRYIYFSPRHSGLGNHGYTARYDTTGSLTAPGSWSGVDIRSASALNSASYGGYQDGVFDGRYVYFVPWQNQGNGGGFLARYDTVGTGASYELNYMDVPASGGSSSMGPALSLKVNTGSGVRTVRYPTNSITAGVWHHVAASYDASTLKLYWDGSLVSSQAAAGTVLNSTAPLSIGTHGTPGSFFKGSLDEVLVFGSSLTDSEIQTIYSNGSAGVCK